MADSPTPLGQNPAEQPASFHSDQNPVTPSGTANRRSLGLDHVPFRVFTDALRSLRQCKHPSIRPDPIGNVRAFARLAQRESLSEHNHRHRAGSAHQVLQNWWPHAGSGPFHGLTLREQRDAVLTRLWKEIAGHIAHKQRVPVLHQESEVSCRAPKHCHAELAVHRKDCDEPHPTQLLSEDDSYVLLCMLSPSLDMEHPVFSMKAQRLAEHYVDALDLLKNAADAKWLMNYADRSYRPTDRIRKRRYADAQEGNFPSVLQAVLQDRCRSIGDSTLTIGRVWRLLDALFLNKEAWGANRYSRSAFYDEQAAESKNDVSRTAPKCFATRKDIVLEKKELRLAVFRELVRDGSAEENAEIARIVLKDLEVHVRVLRWFHPQAELHFAQRHDLRRLVCECRSPSFELGELSVQPGSYASVMLAARPARASLAQIAKGLCGRVGHQEQELFYIEPKLDGERLQLHKMDNQVFTFSRSSLNSSTMYASLLREAVLKSVVAKNAVLDGEVVVWYRKSDQSEGWLPFEDLRRAMTHMLNKEVPLDITYSLKYVVFDVLYVELYRDTTISRGSIQGSGSIVQKSELRTTEPAKDCCVIRCPLAQRRLILNANISPRELRSADAEGLPEQEPQSMARSGYDVAIEVVEAREGSTVEDMMNALTNLVDRGYEGLVAKNPSSKYLLGQRETSAAVKLKPDYFDGGLQDLDVTILGGKLGKGQGRSRGILEAPGHLQAAAQYGRSGDISSFLIGVRSHNDRISLQKCQDGEVGTWTPIGSIGIGYSLKELQRLLARLRGHWHRIESKGRQNLPFFWDVSKSPYSMFRDVVAWVDPRDSVVLTVRAYEVSRANGLSLRFPRCDRIRPEGEKAWWDVLSVAEVLELDECKPTAFVSSSYGKDEDEVQVSTGTSARRKQRNADMEAIVRLESDNARVTRSAGGKRAALSHATGANVCDITERSRALEGCVFVVYASHGDTHRKHALERRLFRLGGSFDLAVSSRTTHCAAFHDHDERVLAHVAVAVHSRDSCNQTHLRKVPVLRATWVDKCEKAGSYVRPAREDLYFAGEALERELHRCSDRYGDSWTEPATEISLGLCLQEVGREESSAHRVAGKSEMSGERANLEILQATERALRNTGALFLGMRLFVALQTEKPRPRAAELLARYGGAVVVSDIEESTHILHHVESSVAELTNVYPYLRMAKQTWISDEWVVNKIRSWTGARPS